MKQFDVFENPIFPARRQFPYVVVLQADVITGQDRVVAPLSPVKTGVTPRLMPLVLIAGGEYALLVLGLTTMRARDLKNPVENIAPYRDAIAAALDLLFQGV